MKLIWHGTASMEVTCKEGKILFDPFVPLKGSPVQVGIEKFDGFSHIFVTHCHLDHIVSLPEIVKRNPDVIIHCSQTPYKTLKRKGISEKNLLLFHYGEQLDVNGFTISVFHGKHAILPKVDRARITSWLKSPSRWNVPYMLKENKVCKENDETVCYQLEADGKTVFLMGSLNLRDEIEYPENADALVLPYNGWEENLPPAIRIIRRLKPKKVLLDHYDDTFPPVSFPVDVSPITQKFLGLVTPMTLNKHEHI